MDHQGVLSGCLAVFWQSGQALTKSGPEGGDWYILYTWGLGVCGDTLLKIIKGSSSDSLEGNNFPLT